MAFTTLESSRRRVRPISHGDSPSHRRSTIPGMGRDAKPKELEGTAYERALAHAKRHKRAFELARNWDKPKPDPQEKPADEPDLRE